MNDKEKLGEKREREREGDRRTNGTRKNVDIYLSHLQ